MKTTFLCWLLSLGFVANTSVAAAPPQQDSKGGEAPVEDVSTAHALRSAARAKLRAEAAAELAAMMLRAVRASRLDAIEPDVAAPLPKWIAEAKQVRERLLRTRNVKKRAIERAQRDHEELQQALDDWTAGAKKRTAVVAELEDHVSDAQGAADKARRAAEDVALAHAKLETLYGATQQELGELAKKMRGVRFRLRSLKQRYQHAAVARRRATRSGAEAGQQGRLQRAVDEAYAAQRAGQQEIKELIARRGELRALELQRKHALQLTKEAVELARRAETAAKRDAAYVRTRCEDEPLREAVAAHHSLDQQRGHLLSELNALKSTITRLRQPSNARNLTALSPQAEQAPEGSGTLTLLEPESARGTATTGLGAGAVSGAQAGEEEALEDGDDLTLDFGELSGSQPTRLLYTHLARAPKPAGELLKGGVAGGEFAKAFQKVPDLLSAVQAYDPSFRVHQVPISARNRLFWLADGRQILLINACRSKACNQRSYTIAYDSMGSKAAFVRRTGARRFDLYGKPDKQVRSLLLWFAGLRIRNKELLR